MDAIALDDGVAGAVDSLAHELAAEFGVDPIDDVEDLRQQLLEQVRVPLLQRFLHDRVVGVAEGLLSDVETLLEGEALRHQKPDQLRDADGGMSVVELDGVVGGELVHGELFPLEPEHQILQGSGGQEVLLLQPQLLTGAGGVVGVQDPGDILHRVLLLDGLSVLLLVEPLEVEVLHGFALPETQGADVVRLVADDGHIVGHGADGLVSELHQHLVGGTAAAPGIAEPLPVIGSLVLIAVPPALLEEAVFIPDAVAVQRQVMGGSGVQEAGGEAPKAAVAQRAILDLLEHVDIEAVGGEGLLHLVQDPQVVEVVVDHAAREILCGEIVSAPAAFMLMTALVPGVGDSVHDQLAQGVVNLIHGSFVGRDLMVLLQTLLDLVENLIHEKPFLIWVHVPNMGELYHILLPIAIGKSSHCVMFRE